MRHRRELQQLTIEGEAKVVATVDLSPTWGGKRQGAGRKKLYPDTVTISVRLCPWEKKLLEHRAKQNGQTLSSYIVQLIRDCELPDVK